MRGTEVPGREDVSDRKAAGEVPSLRLTLDRWSCELRERRKRELRADSLAPLLSVAADDTDVMVRISALDAASRFPLSRKAWQSVAVAYRCIIEADRSGSSERLAALALAVRIPLRSVREDLRRMAEDPEEPDRDAVASALGEAGDPSRIEPLLKRAVTDGGVNLQWLAALPVEDVLAPDDVRLLPQRGGVEQFWRALALARLGEFGPLDAFFSGETPQPELFYGNPWGVYEEIARIRPVPGPMRAHLLEILARLEATPKTSQPDHDTRRVLELTVWAATGIADAEGFPLVADEERSPVVAPAPVATASSDEVNRALVVRAQLPDALFDHRLTTQDFDALIYLPEAGVAALIRDVIAEGNRRMALTPDAENTWWLGNDIIKLIGYCPLTDELPVTVLVAEQLRAERPALDDKQFAWITARDRTDHLIGELARLLRADRTGGERLRILQLLAAAADYQSGRGGSPERGPLAGPGGMALTGSGELVDDIPRTAAEQEAEVQEQGDVEQRTVNARILHDGKRRNTFVTGADNVIRCWVGLAEEDAAIADENIPTVSIPPGGLPLIAQLLWRDGSGRDHTDSKPMLLPAERTARSGDCDLHIHVPERERYVNAEIMFRYRGRAFEAVRVEAFALAADEAEEPQHQIRVRVQASRREVIELQDSQPVDATFVFGDDGPRPEFDAVAEASSSLRMFGGDGGRNFKFNAEVAIRWLNKTLYDTETRVVRRHAARGQDDVAEGASSSAERVLDADDPDVRALLHNMARHGAELYSQLMDQDFKDPGERIQVLNLEPDTYVPLEFVYDRGYPISDAKLCATGLEALKSEEGACPVCSVTVPDDQRSSAPVICPFGFWSLRKVIERVAVGDTGRTSAPGEGRRSLPVVDSVAFASSHLVPESERNATQEALQQHFDRLFLADDWSQWRDAMKQHPSLLIVLPHHGVQAALDYLEIGDKQLAENLGKLSRAQIDRHYVNPDRRDPGPIVLLLGCQTGVETETGYVQMTRRVQQQHASIVLGTLAQILGRHAAPLARELVAQLVAVEDPQADFGSIIRRVRRRMLGRGYLMALCLVALGDAEWRLTPRPPASRPVTAHQEGTRVPH